MKVAYERLVSKLTKENLWMYILSMLNERPMYGYEVATQLRGRFDVKVATITVYVVLYRMSKEGLVRRLVDKESKLGLRKVFYQATEKGLETYRAGLKFIEQTYQMLKKV
jgi:DNA-binding PadR family transcriptional regulator